MIPPKTLNFIPYTRPLHSFRDLPSLRTLPYATYGNAHQITLAAEILGSALYWRSSRKQRSTKPQNKVIPLANAFETSNKAAKEPIANVPSPSSGASSTAETVAKE